MSAGFSTCPSLLERIRSRDNRESWNDFVELYTPLIFHWTKQHGIERQDLSDVVQEILLTLVRTLPSFTYEASQSFRGWLLKVTVSRVRDHQRKQGKNKLVTGDTVPQELAAVSQQVELRSEQEYRDLIVSRSFELARPHFRDDVWRACYEQVVNQRSAEEIAAELGMTRNQVYLAKSRVLARIRTELAGLLD